MRRRAWTAIALAALGLTLGLLGRVLPGEAGWNLVAGLLVLVAVGLAVSLLPFWARLAPDPMPGLFTPPGPRERWCSRCGHATARSGPCRSCGHAPRST